MVVALGVSVAATWLIEAFVLGIVAYLHALLVAVLAVVVALVIAAYVERTARTADRVILGKGLFGVRLLHEVVKKENASFGLTSNSHRR